MHAEVAAKGKEVVGIVAAEETASRGPLPAPPAQLRHRLHKPFNTLALHRLCLCYGQSLGVGSVLFEGG